VLRVSWAVVAFVKRLVGPPLRGVGSKSSGRMSVLYPTWKRFSICSRLQQVISQSQKPYSMPIGASYGVFRSWGLLTKRKKSYAKDFILSNMRWGAQDIILYSLHGLGKPYAFYFAVAISYILIITVFICRHLLTVTSQPAFNFFREFS
jgi:hypothetical protein